jgi:hypothetical protein
MAIPNLVLHTPTDLIAAVPYLLGFHPRDSLVVVGLADARLAFMMRTDLPPPADRDELVDQLAEVIAEQSVERALMIGYGAGARVTPCLTALRAALVGGGIDIGEMLRVEDGRYWSYLCESPDCCPVDGMPYDAASTAVAAAATFAGQVALPDRATLEGRLAPVDGTARAASDRATARVAAGLTRDPTGRRQLAGQALTAAVRCHAAGGRLTDDEVARLALLARDIPIRDRWWARIAAAGDAIHAYIGVWMDVTRRARGDLVPGPATLLASAAWRTGDGSLARVAIERALAADPGYNLALLLGRAIDNLIPPSALDPPRRFRRRQRQQRRQPGTSRS